MMILDKALGEIASAIWLSRVIESEIRSRVKSVCDQDLGSSRKIRTTRCTFRRRKNEPIVEECRKDTGSFSWVAAILMRLKKRSS